MTSLQEFADRQQPAHLRAAPNILLYDIETTPALGYYWPPGYQTNILHTVQSTELLCFAFKWLDDPVIRFVSRQGKRNDKQVAKTLHALFDMADITVAHNGDKFDAKKAGTRFLYWDLKPYSPVQSVDTLKEVRRYSAHDSNRLNELAQFHGFGAKRPNTGLDLWLRCMSNDEDAWAEMEAYNRRDVDLLEQLYLKLRPYIGSPGKPGPNLTHWGGACRHCGSERVRQDGIFLTYASKYLTYRCRDCGGFTRPKKRHSEASNR